MFTAEQKEALDQPLDRANVSERAAFGGSSKKLSYIEGWHAIAEANRIFGHDGWTRETAELRCVQERERKIGQSGRDGWGVSYIARVRIVVFAGESLVIREGVGSGHGIDADLGNAHESAVKEAETDAMKRALSTFGWPFGLALYDKKQEHVADKPNGSVRPDKVVNPKTGRMVDPSSPNQARQRGDWKHFEDDLLSVESVSRLELLMNAVRRDAENGTFPVSWLEQAEEAAEKRRAELTSEDLPGTLRDSQAIDKDQLKRLQVLVDETETDAAAFCKYFDINALPSLPVGRFQEAIDMLNMKHARASANG